MKEVKTMQLDEACDVEYGTRVVRKRDGGKGYPVYGGGGRTFEMNTSNREDRLVIARFGMSEACTRFVAGKFFLNDSGLTVSPKNRAMLQRFLDYQMLSLNDNIYALGKGTAQKNLDVAAFRALPLSFPNDIPEQQRIVGILDEAFAGIATAKATAEKNLQNARALFESHLDTVFSQPGEGNAKMSLPKTQNGEDGYRTDVPTIDEAELARLNAGSATKTGGRDATLRHIPGKLSLSVGMPSTGAGDGWRWSALVELARLESGHTPSRKHPEYWGGSMPWIGIKDARKNHGKKITDTIQKTNELGIANSSARVLPENTVCLSRTASVGYVMVMGRPMATSQDFVNWVCSPKLIPDFLKYLFLAEGREELLRFASGSVHQTIYFPEVKAFHICYPGTEEQKRIVQQCDALIEETQRLSSLYEQKLSALEALKNSLLHQAFAGAL